MAGIRALIKGTPTESSISPCEDTARRQPSMNQEVDLIRR